MGLTKDQLAWNKQVKEMCNKGLDPSALLENTNVELSSFSISPSLKEIYTELKSRLLIFGKDIQIESKKKYIAFKAKKSFVDIEFLKESIKGHINLKKGQLNDPKKICRDVSKVGHFGNGDYEILIDSSNDIPYFMSLAKQSFKINS